MVHVSLVDKVTADHCRNNMEVIRVVPGQPESSFLLMMIEGVDRCADSPQMPVSPRPPLSSAQIQLIRSWITAGARND
jgi:hypothetical protein